MCVNYLTISPQLSFDWFRTPLEMTEDWREEIYRDYQAPFIVHDQHGQRRALLGSYGFVPQRHRPFKKLTIEEQRALAGGQHVRPKRIAMDTMNARAEEVGSKVSYQRFWREQQLCIVPALAVFEPNWESGKHERWALRLASGEPFGMPGMWRSWEEDDGSLAYSFTHFTLNANHHPLLRRFHADEEKRGVAILRPEHYDDWLSSRNPEFARALIGLYPADQLQAGPAPKAAPGKAGPQDAAVQTAPGVQAELF
ncbi:MAG: SOS response-associated peptidase family protein [Duganella sp.]